MIVTQLELETLEVYATLTNQLKKYVILKKDDKGYYIEYAFVDGAPHDNRCLDWYSSYQEGAYIRNHWCRTSDGEELPEERKMAILDAVKARIDKKVGQIYTLHSFTCGYEEDEKGCLEERKKAWDEYNLDEDGNPKPFIPEDHICKVGKPAKHCHCDTGWCPNWTYEEPVKCACWHLEEINGIPKMVSIPMERAMELKDLLLGW